MWGDFEKTNTQRNDYKSNYSKKDDKPSAWEKFKDSFSADRKNYFVLGFDLGLGRTGIQARMIDVSFADIGNTTLFAIPINLRLGYLRDINDNWAFGVSFLYNYMYISLLNSDYGKTTTEENYTELSHTIHRVGGELVIYYKTLEWLHLYFGVGLLADVNSKYKLFFRQYYFEQENKISSWYPLVKFGVLWNINDYVGITTDITFSWSLKDSDYLGVYGGFIMGLQFKI